MSPTTTIDATTGVVEGGPEEGDAGECSLDQQSEQQREYDECGDHPEDVERAVAQAGPEHVVVPQFAEVGEAHEVARYQGAPVG